MKSLCIFLASAMLTVFGLFGAASANLIANGDFQSGDLANWTTNAASNISVLTGSGGESFAAFNVTSGFSDPVRLSQGFEVDPIWSGINIEFDVNLDITPPTTGDPLLGDEFRYYLWFRNQSGDWILDSNSYNVIDQDIALTHVTMTIFFEDIGFDIYADDVNAVLYFALKEYIGGENSIAFLDNVVVEPSAVPLPGTILLLGSGLAGLVAFRRKKFSKRKS